jgi:hypothetical protein
MARERPSISSLGPDLSSWPKDRTVRTPLYAAWGVLLGICSRSVYGLIGDRQDEKKRPAMKQEISHDLGEPQAKLVAEKALSSYQKRFSDYSPQVVWKDPTRAEITFSVKGFSLAGSLAVSARAFTLELDVPLILRPFQGQAMTVIEKEIQAWIKKAKSGTM